ncbi:histidine phosphatase family protein [Ectobacillus ponti]|uniref:Histidine phosphatase family protein n=1 Tax=Ectobacillus ponti TaxID=2961894 RepID=A0AA41X774_9BACI|nr:histidine phosphatase family protein [Ectobacillus ponti]MCP8967553.1 histidine phosphatase family protein [Ectobacillus ponti]
MKVGLMRHFRVCHETLGKRSVAQDELFQWIAAYDAAAVEMNWPAGSMNWQQCFTSDMPRALATAEAFCQGEIIATGLLREIPVYPLFRQNRRLPGWLWLPLLRLAWLFGHPSQREGKQEVESRLELVLESIVQSGEDTLIVSHGALMVVMQRLLRKRGFHGPKLRRPGNGELYIFERKGDVTYAGRTKRRTAANSGQ